MLHRHLWTRRHSSLWLMSTMHMQQFGQNVVDLVLGDCRYTSGSTGKPKGVMHSTGEARGFVVQQLAWPRYRADILTEGVRMSNRRVHGAGCRQHPLRLRLAGVAVDLPLQCASTCMHPDCYNPVIFCWKIQTTDLVCVTAAWRCVLVHRRLRVGDGAHLPGLWPAACWRDTGKSHFTLRVGSSVQQQDW